MGPSPALNAASLALKLSKVVPYRAQIEWYKSWCDEQDNEMGYYDFFKTRGAVKRDMKVNINRHKLARFWNNIIDMLEKMNFLMTSKSQMGQCFTILQTFG
jgi:hypothetical protein